MKTILKAAIFLFGMGAYISIILFGFFCLAFEGWSLFIHVIDPVFGSPLWAHGLCGCEWLGPKNAMGVANWMTFGLSLVTFAILFVAFIFRRLHIMIDSNGWLVFCFACIVLFALSLNRFPAYDIIAHKKRLVDSVSDVCLDLARKDTIEFRNQP